MPRTFTPPSDAIVPTVLPSRHLMNALTAHFQLGLRGRNVYKLQDGSYAENIVADQGIASTISANGSGATGSPVAVTYWGATTTIVSDAEATALTAAGYSVDPVSSFDFRAMSGLVWWLDANRITGLNDGDPVNAWTDVLTRIPPMTQSATSEQPLFKTAVMNGHPVVRFDGVDDSLTTGFWPFDLALGFTLVVVVSVASVTTVGLLDGADGAGPRSVLVRGASGNLSWQFLPSSLATVGTVRNGLSTATASPFVDSVTLDDRLIPQTRFNGADDNGLTFKVGDPTAIVPFPYGFNGVTLGALRDGSAPAACDIAEVLLFDRVLSASDLAVCESVLGAKYGIF